MKFKKLYWLLLVGTLELFVFNACKNPLDGFRLLFKKAKLEIRFSSTTGKLPDDIKLQIAVKEANNLVTNLNAKNFKISKEGMVFLAVILDITPSVQAPSYGNRNRI